MVPVVTSFDPIRELPSGIAAGQFLPEFVQPIGQHSLSEIPSEGWDEDLDRVRFFGALRFGVPNSVPKLPNEVTRVRFGAGQATARRCDQFVPNRMKQLVTDRRRT